MPSQNVVNIIIQAQDKVQSVAKSVEDRLRQIGNTGKSSFDKTSQATQLSQQKMNALSHEIANTVSQVNSVGAKGANQFKRFNEGVQSNIVAFNRLDSETQEMLRYLSQMSEKGRETFLGMSTKAQEAVSKFHEMQNATKGWNNVLDITKTKMQILGTNTDSFKGKIQVVGSAIKTHLGNKWDAVKTKVSEVANSIRSRLSSAVSSVKGHVQGLADKFTGLGGVISSVFGGIGLKGVYDMTVGMATTREQVKTLMQGVMGTGKSFDTLWNKMDTTTDSSLVTLDELSQAMSVIKMSTGASTKEMTQLLPVVNDIGQRAILMGKTGDEAIGLMQAAGKGLNGEFEMLKDNFGVTKDKLKELGWSGEADDIDGYVEALDKFMDRGGSIEGMMDTTSGKMTRLQKFTKKAGRSLGEDFKPYLDDALDTVLKFADANNDGRLDEGAETWGKYAFGAMAVASGFATIAPTLAPILQSLETMWHGMSKAWEWGGKLKDKIAGLGGEGGTIQKIKDKFSSLKDKISSAKNKLSEFKDKLKSSWNEGKLKTIRDGFGRIKDKISSAKNEAGSFAGKLKTFAVGKINALKGAFGNLKEKILIAKTHLVGFLSRLKGIVVEKITSLATSFRNLASGITLATIKEKLYAVWQGIVNGLTAVWNALLAMNPIGIVVLAIVALVGALTVLYFTNDTVRNAINGLWTVIQQVGAFIMSVIVPIIQGVIALLSGDTQGAMNLFGEAWNRILSAMQPVSEFLSGVLGPAWDMIVSVLTTVWTTINQVVTQFQLFMSGQISLPQLLWNVWNLITSMYMTIFTTILNYVVSFARSLFNNAVKAGSNLLKGMITYVSQLPGRIWSYLAKVTSNIIKAGTQWVTNAKNKANSVVTGIMNYIRQLPSKAYSALIQVVSRIVSAGAQWVSSAKSKAQSVVTGVYNKLSTIPSRISSALGGVVSAITRPFQEAYNTAKGVWDKIVSMASNTPKVKSAGYDYLEGQNEDGSWNFEGAGYEYNVNNEFNGEITIVHSLKDVPNNIDENIVANIILESMNDEKIGKALAENMGFQNNDLKIKQIIQGRINRSRGV